jgi:hypothetical protein
MPIMPENIRNRRLSCTSPHRYYKASANSEIRLKMNFLSKRMRSIVLQGKKGSIVLQIGETTVLQKIKLEGKGSMVSQKNFTKSRNGPLRVFPT